MRAFLVLLCLALTQERATLISPKPVDATIRGYEVVGLTIQMPATIYAAPAGPTLAAPPRFNLTASTVLITYIDNVGTQYVDVHNETSGAAELIRLWLDGTGGSVRARLLQHLIDEKKIPPARITKEGK